MKKMVIAVLLALAYSGVFLGCGDETTVRGYSDTDVQNMLVVYRDSILQELVDSIVYSSTKKAVKDTIYVSSQNTNFKTFSNDSFYEKIKDSLYLQIFDSVYKTINIDSIQDLVISATSGLDPSSSSASLYEFELKKKASWKQFNPDITYGELVDKRDNQKYKTIKIGSFTWMAENLNFVDSTMYQSLKGGNSECYKNYEGNCVLYGRLYTMDAILDYLRTNVCNPSCSVTGKETPFQGICPDGWHLPDATEFIDLIYSAGNVIKVTGTPSYDVLEDASGLLSESSWDSNRGTNTTGFSLLAGGSTRCDPNQLHCFKNIGSSTSFWVLNYNFGEGLVFNGGNETKAPSLTYYNTQTTSMPLISMYHTRHVRCVQDK